MIKKSLILALMLSAYSHLSFGSAISEFYSYSGASEVRSGNVRRVRENYQTWLIINGEAQKKYDWIYEVVESRSGKIAYRILRDGQELVVVDGIEGKPYDEVKLDQFGLDEKIIYQGRRGKQWFRVIGNREDSSFDITDKVILAGTSQAFWARRGNAEFYVINGVEGPAYEKVESGRFGSDGKSFMYIATREGQQMLVRNGVEGPPYRYITIGDYTDLHGIYLAAHEPKLYFVVRQGLEGKPYPGNPQLWVSSGGKQMVQGFKEHGKEGLVINGSQTSTCDSIEFWGELGFSPTEDKIFYVCRTGDKNKVLIGKAEGPWVDNVTWFAWNRAGQKTAYVSAGNRKHTVLFLDHRKIFSTQGTIHRVGFTNQNQVIYVFCDKSECREDEYRVGMDGKTTDMAGAINYFLEGKDGSLTLVILEQGKCFFMKAGQERRPADRDSEGAYLCPEN